jgi:dUTP pyrophosphatase
MEKNMKIEIKKLRENAIIPKYQTPLSAGFDLHAAEDVIIPAGEQRIVPTGVAVSVPAGFEIQIRPRSGLAAKHSITITNSPGTLDADYLDEIFGILFNMGKNDFIINQGDRMMQAVLKKVEYAEFEVVENFSDAEKDRGGGFGSTGVK